MPFSIADAANLRFQSGRKRGLSGALVGGGGGGGGAPVNTAAPVITGTPTVGQTLTISPGTWTGSPTTFAYQWYRGGFLIDGATASTYALGINDSFRAMTVRVVATNGTGSSDPASSAPTALVAEGAVLWEMFEPHTSLAGRTIGAAGPMITQALDVSPIGAGGSVAYTLNGAPATPDLLLRVPLTITTPLLDSDLLVTFYDAGTGPLNPSLTGGKLSSLSGSINYTPVPGSGASFSNPGVAAETTAGGVRAQSTGVVMMRSGGWEGTRWSQGVFPQNITFQHVPFGRAFNAPGVMKIGPIIKVTRSHKPVVALTVDDMNSRQYTELFGLLQGLGNFPATAYLPVNGLGGSGKFTLGQAQEMKAAGWAFCQTSGPNDQPIVIWPTVADAIANLNSHGAAIVAQGLATNDDVKHIGYSYGPTSYNTQHETLNCTSSGTTTLTTSSNYFSNRVAPGMRVKGTGLAVAPVVLSITDESNAILSAAVPSGSYPNLRFCAMSSNIVVACNGTTTVTGVNTTGIVVGMTMQGRNITGGPTVTAINTESTGTSSNGTITLSAPIDALCTRATFFLAGSEWLPGRLQDGLIAAGYRSGVGGTGSSGVYTGFGIPARQALGMSRLNIEISTAAQHTAEIQASINNGQDSILRHHWVNAMTAGEVAEGIAILNFLAARRDAGEIDLLTIPQWWDRVSQRTGPV